MFTVLTSGFVFKSDLFSAFVNYGENSTHKVYALHLPDTLRFAGESFDITSPDLRERLDRELLVNTYWQSNMMLLLKRSNKFFPIIDLSFVKLSTTPLMLSGCDNIISSRIG